MKKATIKDVAKATGLSLGTISKYINGGTVKEANKQIIDRVIKDLGYEVDTYARGMVTKKTKTIGLVIPEFNNLFYASFSGEFEKELDKYGYALVVRESFYDYEKERQSIEWLKSRRTDAIILAPVGTKSSEYEYLKQYNVPIIFIDRLIPNLDYEFFIVDNKEVCKKTVGYLLDNGHNNILMLAAKEGLYTADERVKGYIDAYKERNIDINNNLIVRLSEEADDAYHFVKRIIKNKSIQFSAIFAANYPSTIGTIFALNELKISIPSELSVVGFDDVIFTKIFRPKLTIVNQPIEEMAKAIAIRILSLVDEINNTYNLNEFKCIFAVNDSTSKIN